MIRASAVRRLMALLGVAAGGVLLAVAIPKHREPMGIAHVGSAAPEDDSGVPTVSTQVADRAIDRFQLFQTGNGGERLSLAGSDLSAVLRFVLPVLIPPGVTEPTVEFVDGRVRVRARVATATLRGSGFVASVGGVLPDTLEVEALGRLEGAPGSGLLFQVTHMTAGRVPLPPAVVGAVMASLYADGSAASARGDVGGDVIASLRVSWPRGVSSMAVLGDRLVLERFDSARERAVDGSGGK